MLSPIIILAILHLLLFLVYLRWLIFFGVDLAQGKNGLTTALGLLVLSLVFSQSWSIYVAVTLATQVLVTQQSTVNGWVLGFRIAEVLIRLIISIIFEIVYRGADDANGQKRQAEQTHNAGVSAVGEDC